MKTRVHSVPQLPDTISQAHLALNGAHIVLAI
jgi:hypothetical protein